MTAASKVALVTGASAGIGRACADRLSAAGWTVVGVSRRGTGGDGWDGLVVDVDDDRSVRAGLAQVVERHARIDALVAAAGWGLAGPVEDTPLDEARAQLETNFWGCVRVVQGVLPLMRAQQAGRLVLVSSIGGVIGIPFQAFYSASKFALEGLGEALAYEVAPFGISVTMVEPGNVATEFTASRRTAGAGTDAAGSGGASGGASGAYARALDKAIRVMEHDEVNGADSTAVAAVVAKVLEARRPPRRISVGKAGERVGLLAKRLMPYRLFESAAKGSLGV